MPSDDAAFRQVLGHFPTGVTVVTAIDGDRPAGFAVGSFFSVSLRPALVGFCADKGARTWPAIRRAGSFCVNVLAHDQEALCRTMSATSGEDRFADVGWSPAASGSPLLDDVIAYVDCDIDAVHDAGDHEICVGRVRELAVVRQTAPLVFFRGGYGRFAS